ncbi:hypothetical protein KY290_025378 [Solanum tuberosum]|uniref:Uncharacterized protein n=1 Tax=Solanum tuberosum TaxID=4113 RepID=A0ABQ7UVG4_SOLTU|nr:hypothetical protein KY290_025378 [Solanum tuberosum]
MLTEAVVLTSFQQRELFNKYDINNTQQTTTSVQAASSRSRVHGVKTRKSRRVSFFFVSSSSSARTMVQKHCSSSEKHLCFRPGSNVCCPLLVQDDATSSLKDEGVDPKRRFTLSSFGMGRNRRESGSCTPACFDPVAALNELGQGGRNQFTTNASASPCDDVFHISLNALNRVSSFVDSKGILFDMFKLSFSIHLDLSEVGSVAFIFKVV